MNLYAFRDIKSGKVIAIDFDHTDGEVERKYKMLVNKKGLPPLMLEYPEDFEMVKIGQLNEDVLEVKPEAHVCLFRLSDLKEVVEHVAAETAN